MICHSQLPCWEGPSVATLVGDCSTLLFSVLLFLLLCLLWVSLFYSTCCLLLWCAASSPSCARVSSGRPSVWLWKKYNLSDELVMYIWLIKLYFWWNLNILIQLTESLTQKLYKSPVRSGASVMPGWRTHGRPGRWSPARGGRRSGSGTGPPCTSPETALPGTVPGRVHSDQDQTYPETQCQSNLSIHLMHPRNAVVKTSK